VNNASGDGSVPLCDAANLSRRQINEIK